METAEKDDSRKNKQKLLANELTDALRQTPEACTNYMRLYSMPAKLSNKVAIEYADIYVCEEYYTIDFHGDAAEIADKVVDTIKNSRPAIFESIQSTVKVVEDLMNLLNS